MNSDNIYYNIRINSSADNQKNYSSVCAYDATRNNPIIENPSDYYVAVIDFEVPASLIPITIARVQPNQDPLSVNYNPNRMLATFAITYGGITYVENVIYIPTTTESPPIQDKLYQVITYYYFVYTYNWILQAFNNAIQLIMTKNSIPGPAPYFVLSNTTKQLIQLIVPNQFISQGCILRMNNYTANYLSGFDYFFTVGNNIDPLINLNPLEFTFFTTNNICDQYGKFDPNGNYWLFQQQYYCLTEWDVLKKIIIYTSSIPIELQETTSNNLLSPDLSNLSPILLSFTPQYKTSSPSRTNIFFTAEEQYRLCDLKSTIPLKKINIQVAWQNSLGEVYPIYLQPYQSCTIQLGFFKKTLYNNKI